jgi:type III secretory pathway component EscV
MFNFNGHLQELRANIVSIVLILSATIIGFVWISIGMYHWLSACLGAVWGPIVLGLIYFIPIIIFAFIKAFVRPSLPQNQNRSDQADATVLNMSKVFESLSGRSPLLATSAVVIAGVLATRFPALLSVFTQILAAYAEDVKMRAAKESYKQESAQAAQQTTATADKDEHSTQ